jgi:flagellar hook-length control protein FliK
MQVQPAIKSSSQQASTGANAAAIDGQVFPNNLLQAFSLIPQPPPQGPEPPFLPPRPSRCAEEAAKVPNVTSQKLDSPLPNPLANSLAIASQCFSLRQAATVETAKQQDPKSSVQKTENRSSPSAKPSEAAPTQNAEPKASSPAPKAPAITQQPLASQLNIVSIKQTSEQALPAEPSKVETVNTAQTPVAKSPTVSTSTTSSSSTVNAVAGLSSNGKNGGGSSGSSSKQSRQDKQSDPQVVTVVSPGTTKGASSVKAPAELTALKGTDRVALVQQVANKMQALAASRSKEGVVVQLAPKALGTITLTLKNSGNTLNAHISASNDHVRNALETSRPDLVQSMSNRGYRLNTVTVSQESAASTAGNRQQQAPNPRHSGSPRTSSSPDSPSAAVSASARPAPTNASGVDVWI